MRRREFIAGLGGAVAWPIAAHAQQAAMPLRRRGRRWRGRSRAMPVSAFVNGGAADTSAGYGAAFRKGLSKTGYVEGQNVSVEYHWFAG
jgi:putative tryptophan/tyrosine transport system substrate-binding protein